MLKKVKSKKIKGYNLGGHSVMPENTTRPGPLYADQLTARDPSRYGSKNLLKKTGLIKV